MLQPQVAQEGPPVQARQHEVEDEDVELSGDGAVQPLGPVGRALDLEALFAQGRHQDLREVVVVLNEKHPHRAIVPQLPPSIVTDT